MQAVLDKVTNRQVGVDLTPTIHALCGVVGSGKSTYAAALAKQHSIPIVCPDSIRKELSGDEGNQDVNATVFYLVRERIAKHLINEGGVVYDACCYNEKNRKLIYELAENANLIWYVIQTPIEECKARNLKRNRVVPEWVIDKQSAGFSLPSKGKIVKVQL